MSTFLNAPFGSQTGEKYSTGGVAQVFLIPKTKVLAAASTLDGTGTKNVVTGFTLASGATFQEIVCVEDTAHLDQAFKLGTSRKFVTQTLGFTVAESGAGAVEKTNQIVLPKSHVAIVKVRDGLTYVAGLDFGLKASEVNNNSGAKGEDDAALTFVLTGNNLGYAAELQVAPADLAQYVTYAQ